MYYERKNGMIIQVEYNGTKRSEYLASQDFRVEKVYSNIFTGEQEVEIAFVNNIGEEVTAIFPVASCKNEIPDKVAGKGFDIEDFHLKYFWQILKTFIYEGEVVRVHDKLGFHKIGQEEAYLFEKSVGMQKPSQYRGKLIVTSEGSLVEWLHMVEKWVIPFSPAMFALAVGFSAPLASLLAEKISCETLLVCFAGKSSSGKTSLLRLIASIYGKATIGSGVMGDFNDTDNYIIESLADRHGFAALLDEATTKKYLDNFVYSAAGGISKGRCGAGGEMKERKQWSGTIVMTCEGSAIAKTEEKEGEYVRLLEVSEKKFTGSDERRKAITSTIHKNYGLAIGPFVEFLFKKGRYEIAEDYDLAVANLTAKIVLQNDFSGRLINKLAIILLAGRYAKECFVFDDYSDSNFVTYLAEQHDKILARMNQTIIEDPLECLQEYILNHQGDFLIVKNAEYKNTVDQPKGKIFSYDDKSVVVYIRSTCFHEAMKEAGFSPADTIAQFADEGRLTKRGERGNYAFKETFPRGLRPRVYAIRIVDKGGVVTSKIEELLTAEELAKKRKPVSNICKKNKTKENNRKSLLEDD